MNKTWLIIIGGVLVVLVAGVAQFFSMRPVASPFMPTTTATSTIEQNVGTTTTSIVPTINANVAPGNPTTHPLPLVQDDTVVSWNFKGAYADNPELVAKAKNEIGRLSVQLAIATSSAMILSVGIANQYELLGDGTKQYVYLERAVQANPTNGLPWHNLGVLMERLGALQTARIAYEKSTLVQSELEFYHYAYIEFLILRMKDDTVVIEKAFTAAEKNIGQTPYLLELRAEWKQL